MMATPKKVNSSFGRIMVKIFFVLLVLPFLWYFRPWFHDFFMFFYTNPLVLEVILIFSLIYFILFKKRKGVKLLDFKEGKFSVRKINIGFSLVPLLILILMFSPMFSSLMPQLHIVDELDYNEIDRLPETTENVRLMPYDVAYRYSKDSLQLSQYKLGTENIANIDGSIAWMFPIVPDGAVLKFTLKNKGTVFVNATTQEKNSRSVWKDLNFGEGMQIIDNLNWNLYKEKYIVDLDDPYYIPYEDDLYTVVPAITYSYHHFFGLLYTVPRFGGVFLMDSSGNIEFLSPEQAKNNNIIGENRLFPENLARYYIEAYVYNKGLINKIFIHEDQIDITDVGGINKQPFLMDTSEGLKWFISTEPYGESHGIFKIFLVDAVDGKIEKYELPIEETLTGPIKSMDFVKRENPLVDWNTFRMVEPLPFVADDTLFWKVVVIPYDSAGIAYQAFVNSKTNEVFNFETDKEILSFINTGKIENISETTGRNETKEDKITEIKKKLGEIEKLLEEIEE